MMHLSLLFVAATSIRPDAAPGIPYRQPQLATANGVVGMAFGGGTSIYYTSSKDQGRSFGSPVKVGDTVAQ